MRQRVADSCNEIHNQTNELRRLLRDIGTRRDDYELRAQITELRKTAFAKVESTTELFTQLMQEYGHSADRGQAIAINSLRQTFTQSANEFGRVYEQIVNKLQQNPRPKSVDSANLSGELEVSDDRVKLINQQGGKAEVDFQTDYQLTTASYNERRVEDMMELQSNMEQLHEIMNSISRMVVGQGEDIQHIEAHVERASSEVDSGNKQLGTAVRYKKCNRRLTFVIVIVVTIIIVVLIVAILIGVCGFAHACGGSSSNSSQ